MLMIMIKTKYKFGRSIDNDEEILVWHSYWDALFPTWEPNSFVGARNSHVFSGDIVTAIFVLITPES